MAWRKLRRDLFTSWNEKYSRVAVQLEVERLQKEIFMINAEIAAKDHTRSILKDSLDDAKTRLKAIEDYV